MPSDYRQFLVYILCQHQRVTGSPILDQASEQLFHSSQQSQTMANHREGSNQDSITSAARATSTLSQHKKPPHHYPFGFSRGLGYQPEVVIQLALANLIEMIITVSRFTLFIHLSRQGKPINGIDKQLLYRA